MKSMTAAPEGTPQTLALRKRQRFWALLMRGMARLELGFDRLIWGLRRRFGHLGPLQVVTYRSYGTSRTARLSGRVLEASMLERSLPADTRLRSFRRMLRRFNSKELPDAALCAHIGSSEARGVTDDEGYFELSISAPELSSVGVWKTAEVEVVAAPVRGLRPVRATAEVLVPSSDAELGVISDIDDTVLQTHVTRKLKMIWVTLSGSAFTRMPFEGTSELYRKLCAGKTGRGNNPVFYVSKSPWNLYDFLVDFMDYHELPRGPLLLRDVGLREAPPIDHKTAAVARLLETYPDLPFILIGDSGERDPDIYLETAARHPGRVRAIYIRDLGASDAAAGVARSRALRERAERSGTELLWMTHASVALEHARSRGWVR
jgi:phosphatidate phosphatase APP1